MTNTEVLVDTSILVGDHQLDRSYLPAVSIITVGELYLGVLAAPHELERTRRHARYQAVVGETNVINVGERIALAYAEIRHRTGRKPANDLWIAATAVAHRFPLVTADEPLARLGKQVPGLEVIYVG